MSGHCYRRGCRCTHTDPCEHGWIELPPLVRQGLTYPRVGPCPICRPEASRRLADSITKRG